MKQYLGLLCFVLLVTGSTVTYSQKLSVGLYSGVNFSDIHGQYNEGKWSHKPGPSEGFNLEYAFNRYLGLQSGINFSTNYYETKSYDSPIYDINPYPLDPIMYWPTDRKMDFSFVRVPLLFTVTIPAAINLKLKAGSFYSFLVDNNLPDGYYSNKPLKRDFGYIFSSVFSCPLTGNIEASFETTYLKGQKEIFKDSGLRHGASEFKLGLTYNGFLNKKKSDVKLKSDADTLNRRISVLINAGFNTSWNATTVDRENYSLNYGPSAGFLLDYRLSRSSSLQSGISFERKGYSFSDSSDVYYLNTQDGSPLYDADTKIDIDYIVIPVLLNFNIGRHIFFNTGPWVAIQVNSRCRGVAYNESRSQSGYFLRKTVVYDDMEKIIKDSDIGWLFGGGLTLPVAKNYKANIGIRYSTGFTNVFDQDAAGYLHYGAPEMSIRNGTLSFLIGLTIPQSHH